MPILVRGAVLATSTPAFAAACLTSSASNAFAFATALAATFAAALLPAAAPAIAPFASTATFGAGCTSCATRTAAAAADATR